MNLVRCILVVTIVTLLTATSPAAANSSSKWFTVIQKAFVDLDENNLTIIGKNLERGRPPTVWLAEERLHILSASDYWIVVELPDGVEPGDYLLTVKAGYGSKRIDRFDLTIPDPSAVSPSKPKLDVIHVEKEYLGRNLNANTVVGLDVACPEGTKMTGGGVSQIAFRSPTPPTGTFDYFVGSEPVYFGTQSPRWVGLFYNPTSSPVTIDVRVSALCASIE
jgi:hypothetical protein